jgi:GTP-binding protein
LFDKPRWLLINKIDLVPEEERAERIKKLVDSYQPSRHFVISGISGLGCKEVCFAIMDHLENQRAHLALDGNGEAPGQPANGHPDGSPDAARDS